MNGLFLSFVLLLFFKFLFSFFPFRINNNKTIKMKQIQIENELDMIEICRITWSRSCTHTLTRTVKLQRLKRSMSKALDPQWGKCQQSVSIDSCRGLSYWRSINQYVWVAKAPFLLNIRLYFGEYSSPQLRAKKKSLRITRLEFNSRPEDTRKYFQTKQ